MPALEELTARWERLTITVVKKSLIKERSK